MQTYSFTERFRTVLALSHDEAARRNHEYVGTEHLLLGLMREGEGVGAAVLRNLGLGLDEIRSKVDEMVKPGPAGRGTRANPTGTTVQPAALALPYTSRAKKVLEFAASESNELGHANVSTEHLLLGLLREQKGIAGQLLVHAGLSLDTVRAEVIRLK